MARRRRTSRKRRSSRRVKDSTSAIQVMGHRLLRGGPEYLEENLIRLMQDSGQLQQEPEFANLYFNLEQILTVAARQFARFRRSLERAARVEDQETFATTYDDYRIAVIDELATPEFRAQLKRNLDRCIERLKHGENVELFESATFISVLLDTKEVGEDKMPLGTYGLVTMIYEASFDRAMLELPNARDRVGDALYTMWQAEHQSEDLAILEQAASAANTFEELLNEVDDEPRLAIALQRQEEHLVDELQQKTIGKGLWFEANFFTDDEIKLSLERMETKYLSKPWSLSRYISLLAMFNLFTCVKQVLGEIITPQRRDEAIEWWQEIGQGGLTTDEDTWRMLVPNVLAAIKSLQTDDNPGHNFVMTIMYVAEGVRRVVSNKDNLSPTMIKTFKRQKNSIFWNLMFRKK